MKNLNILVFIILAISHMLNIGMIIFIHANGRRISGVVISFAKVIMFFFTALMLQTGRLEAFHPIVAACFYLFTVGAVRRSWLLIHLFREKANDLDCSIVN